MSDDNLPDNKAIVDRADSLMHRRQRPPPPAGSPLSFARIQEEEDFPVLTDIVTARPAEPSPHTPPQLEALTEQLAQSIQAKLAAEIPVLVEAALHNALAELSQTLCSGLEETVQDGVRDFLKKTRE